MFMKDLNASEAEKILEIQNIAVIAQLNVYKLFIKKYSKNID